MLASNIDGNNSDAAGNALAHAYTVIGSLVLWCLLALAFLLAAARGTMPTWSSKVAIVLLPLSCAAAIAVTHLVMEREAPKWMLSIHALVPPLVLAYVGWAIFPRFGVMLPGNLASGILWSVVLLTGLLPWQRVIALPALRQQRNEVARARYQAQLDRFNRLTPTSPILDWLEFARTSSQLYDEAIRKIRVLPDRQTAFEQMLNRGEAIGFDALWNVELAATPALCDGARKVLRAQSIALRPSAERTHYRDIYDPVDGYVSTLHWLTQNRCPMQAELDALEATVRAYPDGASEAILLFVALREMRHTLASTTGER